MKKSKQIHIFRERLDLCLSAGNLAWWEMDVKTGKVLFNENKVKMLGYAIKEFTDVDYTAFTDLVHPDDYEKVMNAMRDHLEGRKNLYEIDYRIKSKDGSYKWFHDRGSIIQRDSDNQPMTIKGIVFDITELKETELQLKKINDDLEHIVKKRTKELEKVNKKLTEEVIERKSAEEYANRTKQHLRNIIDSANECIFSLDMNNRISIWNKTAEQLTGYSQIEVLNRSIGKIDIVENHEEIIDFIKQICNKKTTQYTDIILKTKDYNKRIVRMSGTEIKSTKNECIGTLFIGKDITTAVELHKQLLPGNSYLILDKSNSSSIDLLIELSINDFHGLIITRGNPTHIQKKISNSTKIKIAILSSQNLPQVENITNFTELEEILHNFNKYHKKSVILLDGIHYLLSKFSFEDLINFLFKITDIIVKNKSILFVRLDPSTIDSMQLALIKNELLLLPSQRTEDLIIEDALYDILKFIYKENKENAMVSVKKIKSRFAISYVTAASRLGSLESKGLIRTRKHGKIRAIFITEKGKKLLHSRKIA